VHLLQGIPHEGPALIVSTWPQSGLSKDSTSVRHFEDLQALIRSIRNARAEYSVEPAKWISAIIVANPTFQSVIDEEKAVLVALSRLDPDNLRILSSSPGKAMQSVHLVVADGLEAYLPLTDMVDIGKEVERLNKQASKLQLDLDSSMKRLSSTKFVEKAPAAVVQGVRDQAKEAEDKLQIVKNRLSLLESMAVSSAQ
jgi:valyl-tRNA synthetase